MYVHTLKLQVNLVGDSEHNIVIIEAVDFPEYARTGNDFIAFGKGRDHTRMLLLALTLWTDGNKIKQNEQSDQKNDLKNLAATATGGGLGCLCLGAGYEHGVSCWSVVAACRRCFAAGISGMCPLQTVTEPAGEGM
ncbi:MAG: hypothetical protein ACI87W_002099 [Halieaceae bacterium]|jgi:hypothetical protein